MLIVNSAVVGQVDTNPAYAQHNRKGEQFEVQLDKSYPVTCIVMGGNPPPAVSLSSGMMPSVPYEGVHVTHRTDRDSIDRMSDPLHTVNATVTWKATLQNIGQAFNCKAGVDNPVAVWTSFVPVVTDSKLRRTRVH